MLDHVTLTVADLAASLRFYDAALAPLGLTRLYELGDEEEDDPALEVAAYGQGDTALLWVAAGAAPTRGVHLALRAGSVAEVEAFHTAALSAGGTSHDAPRRWAIFRRGQFNAIVADPDGNLVEAIAPE